VSACRRFIAQRHLAGWLCAAALLLKLLVPPGYMIGNAQGRVVIELCSGVITAPMTMTHGDMAHHGMPDHAHQDRAHKDRGTKDHGTKDHGAADHGAADHGAAEMPCAFAGHAAAVIGAADPIQIAALIAFVMAVGLGPTIIPAVSRRPRLRPPLRGPPLHALIP
jgi:hypothetical protein